MFLSDIPARVAIPFANAAGSGYIRPIPVPSQIGITDGAASFTDGFPPDTFQPLSGGGAYVNGEDVNGILNYTTKWTRWQSAGGPATFNSVFCTAINGYPKLATLQSVSTPGVLWLNTVDGNLTDPDGGGAAGWVRVGPAKASDAEVLAGVDDAKYVTPHGLDYALGNVVPVKASLAAAQAGLNDTDFITPLVLRQLFQINANATGQWLDIGPLRVQLCGFSSPGVHSFPVPFPNGVYKVYATNANSQGGYVDNAFAYPVDNSTYYGATKASSGGITGFTSNVLALGY